jgi:hypothetical protein
MKAGAAEQNFCGTKDIRSILYEEFIQAIIDTVMCMSKRLRENEVMVIPRVHTSSEASRQLDCTLFNVP